MSAARRGFVKSYNAVKGYGFVKSLAGAEAFLHVSDVVNANLDYLAPGDLLEYETIHDPRPGRAPRAVNIKLIEEKRA
jgi:cold shock CspA family protein